MLINVIKAIQIKQQAYCFVPAAGLTSAERFLLEDFVLPELWQQDGPSRLVQSYVDFCATLRDRSQKFRTPATNLSVSSICSDRKSILPPDWSYVYQNTLSSLCNRCLISCQILGFSMYGISICVSDELIKLY